MISRRKSRSVSPRLTGEVEIDYARKKTASWLICALEQRVGMDENFFDKIDIDKRNTLVPDGLAKDMPAFCEEYERRIKAAGGIDLQILGIGSDGHIGFNEPASSFNSRTRVKTLAKSTILDNARFFGNDVNKVPLHAISMGIGTILDSRKIILLAFGKAKAEAVASMAEGSVSSSCPATILQFHKSVSIFIDEEAASLLKNRDFYDWVNKHKFC